MSRMWTITTRIIFFTSIIEAGSAAQHQRRGGEPEFHVFANADTASFRSQTSKAWIRTMMIIRPQYGTLFVSGAGNGGPTTRPTFFRRPPYNCICVAAYERQLEHRPDDRQWPLQTGHHRAGRGDEFFHAAGRGRGGGADAGGIARRRRQRHQFRHRHPHRESPAAQRRGQAAGLDEWRTHRRSMRVMARAC